MCTRCRRTVLRLFCFVLRIPKHGTNSHGRGGSLCMSEPAKVFCPPHSRSSPASTLVSCHVTRSVLAVSSLLEIPPAQGPGAVLYSSRTHSRSSPTLSLSHALGSAKASTQASSARLVSRSWRNCLGSTLLRQTGLGCSRMKECTRCRRTSLILFCLAHPKV